MNTTQKIAYIGGGNMATALIEGMLKRGLPAQDLHVIDINPEVQSRWRSRGLSVGSDIDEQLAHSNIWVLAVKPQQLAEVVARAKSYLRQDTVVVSIAAGISLKTLSHWLGSAQQPWALVVRAMPNTPALVEKAMTGLVATEPVSEVQRSQIETLFAAVGEVTWVQSDAGIDAITAVSGSGPAYVFRFIEAMMAGGQHYGFSEAQAKQLTLATLAGAVELARQSDEPVSVLRERVTSKGGTTQAALDVMNQGQFFETVVKAMQAAHNRAGELSKEFGDEAAKG